MGTPAVSVIIPAYKESENLGVLINRLQSKENVEVIVSIPEGDEISRKVSIENGVVPITGEAGRGKQLAKGAQSAKGDILLFCHADTALPERWLEIVRETVSLPGVSGGAFRLKFDSDKLAYRWISFAGNLRAELLGLVYGDQAIFSTRKNYLKAGGFAPIPLMEDVDFISRLRKTGKVKISSTSIITSARRYEKSGVAFSVIRNFFLLALYFAGVRPETLARIYR